MSTKNVPERELSQEKHGRSRINDRPAPTVYVVATQHLDVAWLWGRRPDGEELMKACFIRAVEMADAYKDTPGGTVFTRSTPWSFQVLERLDPVLFEAVRAHVEVGRIEPCGGLWVEPDNVIPSGESMLRQALYGQRYYLEKFGRTAEVCWSPDVFAHGNTLPQILSAGGLPGYYFHRCVPVDDRGEPVPVFLWQAPDGSRILCYTGMWRKAPETTVVKEAADQAARTGVPVGYIVTGLSSDRRMTIEPWWYPLPAEAGEELGLPECRWASSADVLHALEYYRDSLPVIEGDLGGYQYTGTYTSDQITKRWNRKLEGRLADVETLAAMAAFSRFSAGSTPTSHYHDDISECWRDLCVNQFHDIICGTCYDYVQKEAHDLYEDIDSRSRDILRRVATSYLKIPESGDTSSSEVYSSRVFAFNLLPVHRRTAASIPLPSSAADASNSDTARSSCFVKDAAGRPVPSQISISSDGSRHLMILPVDPLPPMSAVTFTVSSSASSEDEPSDRAEASACRPGALYDNIMENEFVRVEVDRATGDIVSLFLKDPGVELIRPRGKANRLIVYEDKNDYPHSPDHKWDPWYISFTGKTQEPVGLRTVERTEAGPVRSCIRVTRPLSLVPYRPNTMIVQDIVLYAHSPVVYIHSSGEWYAREAMVKAEFDLAMSPEVITCEMPYGVIDRPYRETSARTVDASAAAEDRVIAGSERPEPDRPMQRWIDVSADGVGLAILNDGKYGYDVADNSLRLSLMRAPIMRKDEIAGLGPFEFTYALYPHRGDWREARVPSIAVDMNRPLIASLMSNEAADGNSGKVADSSTEESRAAFLSLDTDAVELTACKQAEDGDALIVRLFERYGRDCTVGITIARRIKTAVPCDGLERPLDGWAEDLIIDNGVDGGGTLTLRVRPFEIRTVRITFG